MLHLWARWPRIARELEKASHVLLLFDFDGTLAPIVAQPGQARLLPEAHRALLRLARVRRCTLGFVSGRSLGDLENHVLVPHSFYAGNHGLEWEGPGVGPFRARPRPELLQALRQVRERVGKELDHCPGILVEDKGLSLSVHYRGAPRERLRDVQQRLARLAKRFHRFLQVKRGKMVFEFRPSGGPDKGRIVLATLHRLQNEYSVRPLTFYFGDDTGDEPAFAAVSGFGYGVHVGKPRANSAARFRLANPEEVAEFLLRAEGCLAGHSEREGQFRREALGTLAGVEAESA